MRFAIDFVELFVVIGCILALTEVIPLTATTAVILLLISRFTLKFEWSG